MAAHHVREIAWMEIKMAFGGLRDALHSKARQYVLG